MVKYGSYKIYYNKHTHEELRLSLDDRETDQEEGLTKMATEIGWVFVESEQDLDRLKNATK